MARAAARYLFVALLALLSAQAAMPAVRVAAPLASVVWCGETDREPAEPIRPSLTDKPRPFAEAVFIVPVYGQPDALIRFQRPPPLNSLFPW